MICGLLSMGELSMSNGWKSAMRNLAISAGLFQPLMKTMHSSILSLHFRLQRGPTASAMSGKSSHRSARPGLSLQ